MLQVEHSAILSTFIKLPFSIKTFVFSIFKWLLKTGFTVHNEEKESIIKVRIGYEKSVPRDHRLSSLGKPSDANR